MAKNNNYWETVLGGKKSDKSEQELDQGLESISWVENSKRYVKNKIRKTKETFGEEIGNAVTHGVMALFLLGMIPYAAIRAYTHAPEGYAALDSFGISAFMITLFLTFMVSTLYHCMKYNSPQKNFFNKLDHIMIYYAIAGTYTPVCLSLMGGRLGLGLCIAQWVLAILGTVFKSLVFSRNKMHLVFTWLWYIIMGWMVIFCCKTFYAAASPVTFWLILAGGLCYTAGTFIYSAKFKFSHMVWHMFVIFGTVCHFIALVYFLR